MPTKRTGPAAIFGIRIKSILVFAVFLATLLAVINREEILSLINPDNSTEQTNSDQAKQVGEEQDFVIDQEMLSNAMKEVKADKLAELESDDGAIPTDRFFYIVELVSGGDLEGIDLTIEPDHVILISQGGTSTTIKRTEITNIQRHKLPPSPKE